MRKTFCLLAALLLAAGPAGASGDGAGKNRECAAGMNLMRNQWSGKRVAFLGVDDDVEILVRFILFLQRVAEDVLQHADHRRLVDVLQLFEFGKVADEIEIVHCVLYLIFNCYLKSSHSFVYLI